MCLPACLPELEAPPNLPAMNYLASCADAKRLSMVLALGGGLSVHSVE